MFKVGDRIKWQYNHHLNSKSYFVNVKTGVFIRIIKHREHWKHHCCDIAVVKFDGNKNPSRVPLDELRPCEIIKDSNVRQD